MRTNPSRTLQLLQRLEALGFDDSAFKLLHHLPGDSIHAHSNYCQKLADTGSEFRDQGTNTLVQHRLEVVLGAYEGGKFSVGSPVVFRLLAQATLLEVPMNT